MFRLKFTIALAALLLAPTPLFSEEMDAAKFLGPLPGVTLRFDLGNGITMERTAVSVENGKLEIAEKTFFPKESNPLNKPIGNERRFHLYVNGSKLILLHNNSETIALDTESNSWTIPITGTDNKTRSRTCRVDSYDESRLLGRVRKIIHVACGGQENESIVHTLAEGLGIVETQIRNGEKIIPGLRLIDTENAGVE